MQLFKLVRNVVLPAGSQYDPVTKVYYPFAEELPATFAVCWPDGKPCTSVELYLLDIAQQYTVRAVDGGSLKVKVSNLSHLIRFCWKHQLQFWDLDDHTFHSFVRALQQETRSKSASRKRRNNAINSIIAECIAFLDWLQSNILVGHSIVGPREDGARIRLIVRSGGSGRRNAARRLSYPRKLPPEAPDPKPPMPREIRNRLWEAAANLPVSEDESESGPNGTTHQESYLRARRELMLQALEATGCRPAELVELKLSTIDADYRRITLPTLKKRKQQDPLRSIPLDFISSVRLERFIADHRRELLNELSYQDIRASSDYVFLNVRTGEQLRPDALEKDFQRLVSRAGISSRACVSMFRHRFITNMIKLHLAEFLEETAGTKRAMLTDSDYRTVLRKVLPFIGHANEEMLLHYFHTAWEEMGVFDYVQPAIQLSQLVEGSVNALVVLAGNVEGLRAKSKQQLLKIVVRELSQLREQFMVSIKDYQDAKSRNPHFVGPEI